MYQDETYTCSDCGREFIYTVKDQEVAAERGFTKQPTRCQACRIARRDQHNGKSHDNQMFDAVCSECGMAIKVPFRPRAGKPVYCSACYHKNK